MEMRERDPTPSSPTNATRVNFVGEMGDGLGASTAVPPAMAYCSRWNTATGWSTRAWSRRRAQVIKKLRFDERNPQGHPLRGREHYALNRMRPSRLIELERGDK